VQNEQFIGEAERPSLLLGDAGIEHDKNMSRHVNERRLDPDVFRGSGKHRGKTVAIAALLRKDIAGIERIIHDRRICGELRVGRGIDEVNDAHNAE